MSDAEVVIYGHQSFEEPPGTPDPTNGGDLSIVRRPGFTSPPGPVPTTNADTTIGLLPDLFSVSPLGPILPIDAPDVTRS